MANYKITTIGWLRLQGCIIDEEDYKDGECPTYKGITSDIPIGGVALVKVNATCIATSAAYSDNQLVCEDDVTVVKVADCPNQSDVVFLPSYSNYQAGTVDNLLAFNSGNTKFSSIKSLSLTSGDWLSNIGWSNKYKGDDTAWPYIKFTQTENTSTTTYRTGVITVVMNAASGGECSFPITVTQGRHTSICPSFEDVVANGSGQPITGVTVPNTATGCTTGCTSFLWFKTGDTAFSSTGSVTPDGTVITGASFGGQTQPGWEQIPLKFMANTTTTDKNGSVTIKMNATNGDECSYTVPITLKGLPVSVIRYNASTKLDVNLNDFTPAATAETFSNGVGKIEFDAVVTGIGDKAFSGKTAMTGIDIPDTITSIGHSAFTDCNSLLNITIPSNVHYINNHLLYNCTSLTSVTLESESLQFKPYSISNCPNLRKIEMTSVTAYPAEYENALENSAECPIYVPEEHLSDFWISSTFKYKDRVISHIGNNCFVYFADAKLNGGNIGNAYSGEDESSSKLSIASHVWNSTTRIGKITYSGVVGSFHDSAFNTQGMIYMVLPESLKRIGQEVFVSCYYLKSVFIPDSVVGLGKRNGGCETFHNCTGLKSFVAGSGLTSIGTSCFTIGSGLSLTGFTFYSTNAPTLEHKNTFENTGNVPIYVPCGRVNSYKTANIWNDSDIKNRIKAIPPCTS